jgi:hypothetical protein
METFESNGLIFMNMWMSLFSLISYVLKLKIDEMLCIDSITLQHTFNNSKLASKNDIYRIAFYKITLFTKYHPYLVNMTFKKKLHEIFHNKSIKHPCCV